MVGHIVTVGTSLLTSITGTTRILSAGHPPERVPRLNRLQRAIPQLKSAIETHDGAAQVANAEKDTLVAIAGLDPDQEVSFRPPRPEREDLHDFLSQELSYLWVWASNREAGDSSQAHVRLLCSDTRDSLACGRIIAALLVSDSRWKARFLIDPLKDVHVAKGVNTEKKQEFESSGLHNWMTEIGCLVAELRDLGCSPVFLNVTGGYKGTVPYSTLRGMLEDPAANVRLAYLFEESPEIIEIPTYPVGVDFTIWHENARRLLMQQEPLARKYFDPDPRVRQLLDAQGLLQPFGKVLQHAYNRQYQKDPFQTYAKSIVRRLILVDTDPAAAGSSEAVKLHRILETLVENAGDVIWLGDKLPGMVDHSLRHHHDLLEIAESFLCPILGVEPAFLSVRERFVLLAAVLLHDCGHTLDLLDSAACHQLAHLFGPVHVNGLPEQIALFPTDVRDYHHFLTGIRLNDKKLADDLSWPGKLGFAELGLPACLHDAVLLACLNHRRRAPYVSSQEAVTRKKGTLHLTGQFPGALQSHEVAQSIQKDIGVDLMKVAALLRVIDGCDSQVHRAGRADAVDVALNLLERENAAAQIRARLAFQSLTSPHPEFNVTVPGWKLDDEERASRKKHLANLAFGTQSAQESRLWLQAAEAIDRSAMTYKQLPHYLKHFAVKGVRILPAEYFGVDHLCFHVILSPWDEELPRSVQTNLAEPGSDGKITAEQLRGMTLFHESEGDSRPLREVIQEEISSEYTRVAEHAKATWHFEIEYWWQEQWLFWQKDWSGRPFFPCPS